MKSNIKNMHYLCQACLRSGDNVSLMTPAELDTYTDVICKTNGLFHKDLYICVFCRRFLRNMMRFMKQCQMSHQLLKGMLQQEFIGVPDGLLCYNLKCTSSNVLYVGPEATVESARVDVDCEEGGFGGEGFCSEDEDDMPLVMLRGGSDSSDQCAAEPQSEQSEQPQLLGATARTEKKKNKKKKEKEKEVREGFTSRMVQETAEYVVLKLSAAQVAQELAARAQGERYRRAPYRCARCAQGFNFEDVLAAHMDKHSPKNGSFQCELCSQYCPSAVSLRGHMKSHTTRYRCKVCGLVRRSRQHVLEHHALAHAAAAARLYCCRHCRFTTNKRTVMQHHVRSHAAREPHACHRCGKLYKNMETLRIHIARHAAQGRPRCARCSLSFSYAAQLSAHERDVHQRREYYCVECDVTFKSMDTLKLHYQKAKPHRDDSSYKHACAQCPQRFVSAGALATHAHSAHGAPRSARCPLCAAPRAYASRDALRAHLRRVHKHQRVNVTDAQEQPGACALQST